MCCYGRQCCLVDKALTWDSSPGFLADRGQLLLSPTSLPQFPNLFNRDDAIALHCKVC